MAPWVEDNNAPNHRRSGTVDVLGFDESDSARRGPMFIRLDGGQLCCFDARRNLEGLEDEDDDDEGGGPTAAGADGAPADAGPRRRKRPRPRPTTTTRWPRRRRPRPSPSPSPSRRGRRAGCGDVEPAVVGARDAAAAKEEAAALGPAAIGSPEWIAAQGRKKASRAAARTSCSSSRGASCAASASSSAA